jgi:hypothetical protein
MNLFVAGTATAAAAPVRNSQARAGDGFAAAFAVARTAVDTTGLRSPLLAPVLLPTRANVQQLASELAQKLSRQFAAAGLPTTPAVSFAVDGSGAVQVAGGRSDIARVQAMVDGEEALQRSIRDTTAIASHAYEIESGGHLEFQRAYRLSSDPKEIVAQYASQPGSRQRAVAVSVGFSGSAVNIAAGGKTWLAA